MKLLLFGIYVLLHDLHGKQQAYKKTGESEENITAVAMARSNIETKQERLDPQLATSKNVLDAQTLLTRTMNNYHHALNDLRAFWANVVEGGGRLPMALEKPMHPVITACFRLPGYWRQINGFTS